MLNTISPDQVLLRKAELWANNPNNMVHAPADAYGLILDLTGTLRRAINRAPAELKPNCWRLVTCEKGQEPKLATVDNLQGLAEYFEVHNVTPLYVHEFPALPMSAVKKAIDLSEKDMRLAGLKCQVADITREIEQLEADLNENL